MEKSYKLHIARCSYKAAKYAVMRWHYSKTMPNSRLIKYGVWENEKFIGSIIYSYGANNNIGKPYNLKQGEIAELTRVALINKEYRKTLTSKILAITMRLFHKENPKVKMLVSYADLDQEHQGIIYKATNWICEGVKMLNKKDGSFLLDGHRIHGKTISHKIRGTALKRNIQDLKKYFKTDDVEEYITKGKIKYIYKYA